MLIRTQLMLDEKTKSELEKLANLSGRSISQVTRDSLKHGIKVEKRKVTQKTKKMTGIKFLKWLSEHSVQGPGNSEYDKYAYDL